MSEKRGFCEVCGVPTNDGTDRCEKHPAPPNVVTSADGRTFCSVCGTRTHGGAGRCSRHQAPSPAEVRASLYCPICGLALPCGRDHGAPIVAQAADELEAEGDELEPDEGGDEPSELGALEGAAVAIARAPLVGGRKRGKNKRKGR